MLLWSFSVIVGEIKAVLQCRFAQNWLNSVFFLKHTIYTISWIESVYKKDKSQNCAGAWHTGLMLFRLFIRVTILPHISETFYEWTLLQFPFTRLHCMSRTTSWQLSIITFINTIHLLPWWSRFLFYLISYHFFLNDLWSFRSFSELQSKLFYRQNSS